ncbi:hypothetical protein C0215_19355 [Clostridioides difficile]|nr:hypothetical protein C0215_19355 [Clostridioides difficile]
MRTGAPGRLGPSPMAHGVDQLSRATRARVRSPGVPPILPGVWGPGPKALGVDQLSRRTRARVCGPAGSTSSPG